VADPRHSIDPSVLQAVAGRWLHALTDGSREAVALLAPGGEIRFLSVSHHMSTLLGYDAVELARSADLEIIHPADRERVRLGYERLMGQTGTRQTAEYRLRHRLGHYVRVQVTAVNRLDDDIVRAVVVHMRGASAGDTGPESSPLTMLSDRPAFSVAVDQAVERARTDPSYGFSVLMLELDRLKMLVGSYGQDVVDDLLGEVARRLMSLLRPEDVLGQLGGGEFAVLLDAVGNRGQAGRVADRIQNALGTRYQIGKHAIDTSAIIGIATSERTYERAEHVIRDAALAATRARQRGRKRRAVFQTQMRVEDTRFMALVAGLHTAVNQKQFRLYYQPIVSLADQRLCGFEALIRWAHPDRGIVPPDEFIPVAEETGLIAQVGQWVLQEACRQMAEWQERFRIGEPFHVSVNLSAKQFSEDDLPEQVERALGQSGLDPRQLKLEVTESTVLENRDAASAALGRLKEIGVRVSLDDFGTGYSSFSYLHQLPYDTLKIDRSFIARIGEQGENTEIIHAIIVLAHNLRMDVVAEGVETAEQADRLRDLWCEYAQGYYFGEPLPADVAVDFFGREAFQVPRP
jgi:diguanylate cyclase (GGDEF)-like protein/PAS domain S-box-containing protein